MADMLERHSSTRQRKLRVVYVGHVAQLSGGEIALVRLIEALHEVDAHVILAEDGPLVARLRSCGASVEILAMPERTRDLRKDRLTRPQTLLTAVLDTTVYVFRLARRLRALHPDLVHSNSLKAGIYGSLAARLVRVPSVWHVRDRIATDYLPRLAVVGLRGVISVLPNGVVFNSRATRATLWPPITRARPAYELLYSPVPAPAIAIRRRDGDPFIVGMVGRIAPWKGQHIFLEAFAHAFRAGSELAVVVGEPMFGESETQYRDTLDSLTRAMGIETRVAFRGFRDDIWAELGAMNILVHASLSPEPFGQVIVEAMHVGTPVIATAGGGPSEILTHGMDGILYTPGDVQQLAAKMQQLRSDDPLRARLSAAAKTRAADFSPQIAASKAMALYERILSDH